MRAFSIALLSVVFVACSGSKDTDPVTGETGDTTDTTTDTTPVGGFDISGAAIDIATLSPAAEGLCIELFDPSPAITGGLPALLVASTVGAGGAFLFEDVVTDSVVGLLMSVKDCDTENTTVFTSATGVPLEAFQGLGEGDVVADQTAYSISLTFLAGMQASAEAIGYTGDLLADGMMFGFTFDTMGAPVGGATVTCGTCGPTYYLDAVSTDGLFSSTTGINAATDPASGGFIIPAGPIGSYTAEDGGAHTWETQLNGSNPGSAVITAFYGT